MIFKILKNLSHNDILKLNNLIVKCNNYEPYYNCNSLHVAAFTDSKETMTGFISCILDSYNEETDTAIYEISALVSPEYRQKGLFLNLLHKLKEYIKPMHTACRFICNMPKILLKSNISFGYAFSEHLMILKHRLNDLNVISGVSADVSNHYECLFSDDSAHYFLYKNFKEDEEPTALLNIDYQPSFTNIYGVYVDKDMRNAGLGTFLMTSFIMDYFNEHLNPLVLNVRNSNTAAFQLYKKCGFITQSHIDYYYI